MRLRLVLTQETTHRTQPARAQSVINPYQSRRVYLAAWVEGKNVPGRSLFQTPQEA